MKFVIYGPPGIGKSTAIERLQTAGYPAFDLEELPDVKSRELALAMADNCFLGGADTTPRAQPGRINVLLTLPTQDAYAERRAARDRDHPAKMSQAVQTLDQWEDLCDWNAVIVADDRLDDALIDLLIHPGIRVPPKRTKTPETWTAEVRAHSGAVASLMSWCALRLTLAGAAHDQDKLEGQNPHHGELPHHWYRKDNTIETPDLFDFLESICDGVATTVGRALADPWQSGPRWYLPDQTTGWYARVRDKTYAEVYYAADVPLPLDAIPGAHPDSSDPTRRASDD